MARIGPGLTVATAAGLIGLMQYGIGFPGASEPPFRTRAVDRGSIAVTASGQAVVGENGTDALRLVVTGEPTVLTTVRPGLALTINAPDVEAVETLVTTTKLIETGRVATEARIISGRQRDLSPGQTVTVSVVVERRDSVQRVPNAALRWRPDDVPGEITPHPVRPGPLPSTAPYARAYGDLVESVKRELKLPPGQCAAVDTLARQAGEAAFADLDPHADPALKRERAKRMRKDFVARVAALLPEDQHPKLQEVAQASAERRKRAEAQVGRIFVLGDDGRPKPMAVWLGATDGIYTELVGAPLEPGTPVIVGKPPQPTTVWTRLFGA